MGNSSSSTKKNSKNNIINYINLAVILKQQILLFRHIKVSGSVNLDLKVRSITDPKVHPGDVYNVGYGNFTTSRYRTGILNIMYIHLNQNTNRMGKKITLNIKADDTKYGLSNASYNTEQADELLGYLKTDASFLSTTFVKIYDNTMLNEHSSPLSDKEYSLVNSGKMGFLLILNNVSLENNNSINLLNMNKAIPPYKNVLHKNVPRKNVLHVLHVPHVLLKLSAKIVRNVRSAKTVKNAKTARSAKTVKNAKTVRSARSVRSVQVTIQ